MQPNQWDLTRVNVQSCKGLKNKAQTSRAEEKSLVGRFRAVYTQVARWSYASSHEIEDGAVSSVFPKWP